MGSTHPPVGAVLSLLIAAALMVGCGGGGGSTGRTSSADAGASASGADAVTIADYTYRPGAITVPVGATVEFTNQDSTPHTATSKQAGAFESGSIDTGETGTIKLTRSGTFAYYCVFHPFMKGTITVE